MFLSLLKQKNANQHLAYLPKLFCLIFAGLAFSQMALGADTTTVLKVQPHSGLPDFKNLNVQIHNVCLSTASQAHQAGPYSVGIRIFSETHKVSDHRLSPRTTQNSILDYDETFVLNDFLPPNRQNNDPALTKTLRALGGFILPNAQEYKDLTELIITVPTWNLNRTVFETARQNFKDSNPSFKLLSLFPAKEKFRIIGLEVVVNGKLGTPLFTSKVGFSKPNKNMGIQLNNPLLSDQRGELPYLYPRIGVWKPNKEGAYKHLLVQQIDGETHKRNFKNFNCNKKNGIEYSLSID